MYWLIRATQVVTMTYRLLVASLMTIYLVREHIPLRR